METTKTFVLLDLETSGLPRGPMNPCKITEIALVAASRKDILERHSGLSKENAIAENNFIPRVLNKINLAVYPCKMIQPMASEVSGLTNENLQYQKPFDKKLFEIMENFFERLEKPICIVSHNGNKFDFPLLQAEVTKIKKGLPEHIFCADSLPGFRDVLTAELTIKNEETNDLLLRVKPLNGKTHHNPTQGMPKCDWSNDDFNTELAKVVDLAENIVNDQETFNVEDLERKINQEMDKIRKLNENTPGRRGRKPAAARIVSQTGDARRNIMKSSEPKRKLTLGALYQSLTRKEFVNAHQAEGDSLALLECLTAVGRPILDWLDSNKIPFRSIKKMW